MGTFLRSTVRSRQTARLRAEKSLPPFFFSLTASSNAMMRAFPPATHDIVAARARGDREAQRAAQRRKGGGRGRPRRCGRRTAELVTLRGVWVVTVDHREYVYDTSPFVRALVRRR